MPGTFSSGVQISNDSRAPLGWVIENPRRQREREGISASSVSETAEMYFLVINI
jgi:hypothetical protein